MSACKRGHALPIASGFVLLPVVIALTLIATASLALNRSAALEANMAARSLDADAARYAAEAGLGQMQWELQKKNCTGYKDLTDVPFGVHRFSVTASRDKGQPVDLASSATTAAGGSARLEAPRAAVFGNLGSTTIQPADANAADTYVDALNPTLNYGASDRLHVRTGRMHALLRFDLSTVPDSAKIESAQLSLFQAAGSQGGLASVGSIAVHRVARAWTEGTGGVTGSSNAGATYNSAEPSSAWTSAGGDFEPEAAARTELPDPAGWRHWDVTGLVQQWIDGGHPNHGLALVGSGNVGSAAFVSSKSSNSSGQFPMLTVKFRPMCGYDGQPVTKTFNAKADAGVYSQYPRQNYGEKKPLTVGASDRERMLVRFDVASIPAAARVQSARLRLRVNDIQSRSDQPIVLRLHALTVDWEEGDEGGSEGDGVTWNQRDEDKPWTTRGGDFRAQPSATFTIPGNFSWPATIELDVRALVQEWSAKATPNHGLILMHAQSDVVHLETREEGSSVQPQLVVKY